jgi:hypothetical protein
MAIVVICWVSFSLLFCLALLRAAARPRPHAGEEVVVANEISEKESAVTAATPNKAYSTPSRLVTSSPTA